MSSTFTVLVALLVVVSSAEPEEVAEAHHSLGESDEMSEVTTPPKLVLEDPASWSASTEVEDEKHAWYRRRRDAEVVDLEVAESVVFNPYFQRVKKRVAQEECRARTGEFTLWSRHNRQASLAHHHGTRCNPYCCFPITPQH